MWQMPLWSWPWLTLLAYALARSLHRRQRRFWLSPIVLAPLLLFALAIPSHTHYADYAHDTGWLVSLLGPATVAFAVPIWTQRALLESKGFPSVAAEGWKAPGVVVSYTTDPGIQNASKFAAVGLQTASGVPLQCDEGPEFKSFRIGLFGLEKWHNVERTVGHLSRALDQIAAES